MSPAGRVALSAAIGAVVAAGLCAVTALAAAALGRGKRVTVFSAMARGALVRLLGALAGVAAGIGMNPPSVPVFVIVFLTVYLGAHAALVFRARGAAG